MAGTESFVVVPPDSTGKKIRHKQDTVSGSVVQTQVVHLACGENASHYLRVDNRGAAKVSFAEGSPSMDAFGNLRTSSGRILAGYEFTTDPMDDLFVTLTTGGGGYTHQPSAASMVLTTGSTSGDSVSRKSNRYHYYQPGVGMLVITTIQVGDTGKTGNTRRWGYYDETDGPFWELDGTTFKVCLRSSTSGAVVTEEVTQANWNADKLDGSGISGMTLDVSKANFYWIDFAWLGVGPVRFGVLDESGNRVVCHIFENPNNRLRPYMRTGSLPVMYENFNTTATASNSELRLICTAIYAESVLDYTYWRYCDMDRPTLLTITAGQSKPVLSIRPKLTVNGITNRVGVYPQTLSVYSSAACKIQLVYDPVLTDATWSIAGQSTLEGDIGATGHTIDANSYQFISEYVNAGTTNIDLTKYFETNDEGVLLYGDGTQMVLSVVATPLTAGGADISATITYRELR